ncbi:MAG: hypothetical protein AAB910_02730 [Patescibacteria group bacterium]
MEEKQVLELEELAQAAGISVSKMIRETLPIGMKEEKKKAAKRKTKKMSGGEFLLYLAKHAVKGPGDSEYDKYAYDF